MFILDLLVFETVVSMIIIIYLSVFSSTIEVKGDMLTIKSAQPQDYGFVQVFVKNDVHEISSTAFLDVEGKHLSLSCYKRYKNKIVNIQMFHYLDI